MATRPIIWEPFGEAVTLEISGIRQKYFVSCVQELGKNKPHLGWENRRFERSCVSYQDSKLKAWLLCILGIFKNHIWRTCVCVWCGVCTRACVCVCACTRTHCPFSQVNYKLLTDSKQMTHLHALTTQHSGCHSGASRKVFIGKEWRVAKPPLSAEFMINPFWISRIFSLSFSFVLLPYPRLKYQLWRYCLKLV